MECVDDYIIPQFHEALDYEAKFPVKWGQTVLEPGQFADWLGSTFIRCCNRTKEEYLYHRERIYCSHMIEHEKAPPVGEITDTLLAMTEVQIATCASFNVQTAACGGFVCQKRNEFGIHTCGRCLSSVTACCGLAVRGDVSAASHSCEAQEAQEDPLKDPTRGKDHQFCPNPSCPNVIQLREACSHIMCKCGQSFCYLCGQSATANSRHWNTGQQCPRFGDIESGNFSFDAPLHDDAIEIWFPGENGLPFARLFEGEDVREFFFPLTALQQATRDVLERRQEIEPPAWVDDQSFPARVEAILDLAGPPTLFVGLEHHPHPGRRVERRMLEVKSMVEAFFLHRQELLIAVVERLLPEGHHTPEFLDEDVSDGEDDDDDDDDENEADDDSPDLLHV